MSLTALLAARKPKLQVPKITNLTVQGSQKLTHENSQESGLQKEQHKAAAHANNAENSVRGRIKKLLVAGVSQVNVAQTVGVTEAYVSQLMAEEDFAREVGEGRTSGAAKAIQLNEDYDRIESKLIKRLEQAVDNGSFYKPRDLLQAISVVGNKKRTPVIESPTAPVNGDTIINLQFAPRIAQKFIIDARKNVIGIGDKPFIPMSSAELLKDARMISKKLQEIPDGHVLSGHGTSSETQTIGSREAITESGDGRETARKTGRRDFRPSAGHPEIIFDETDPLV